MIEAKAHNEKPNISTVTREVMRPEADATDQGNIIHQWVRKVANPLPLFDPRKDKRDLPIRKKIIDGGRLDSIKFDHATLV